MAYTITIEDVKNIYFGSAGDAAIQMVIDFVDLADDCLDSSGSPDAAQRLLKIYACAHMLTVQDGGGVSSESDMDGESVTFANVSAKGTKSVGKLFEFPLCVMIVASNSAANSKSFAPCSLIL